MIYSFFVFFKSGIGFGLLFLLSGFYSFSARAPLYGELLITEIMADPSPPEMLPEQEFVELFNVSNDTLLLATIYFSDAQTKSKLPSVLLAPGDYLILCAKGKEPFFTSYGTVAGLSPWPSLNNDADQLSIQNASGEKIFMVHYSVDWYRDPLRGDGGYSLEMIDPESWCKQAEDWCASSDDKGGTPGQQNSVWHFLNDTQAPSLIEAHYLQAGTIELFFDEAAIIIPSSIHISPSVVIDSVTISFFDKKRWIIYFQDTLPFNSTIFIQEIQDCIGNKNISATIIPIIKPALPEKKSLQLSEVLFNPYPYGSDFIELYNVSGKILNLNGLRISNGEDEISVSGDPIFLAPHSYVVLTKDSQNIKQHYNCNGANFLKVSLPALPDDEGELILITSSGEKILHWKYSSGMHHTLLKDQEGVSLERISLSVSENESGNWTSASESSGFATPGNRNSCERPDHFSGVLHISPEVICPGGNTEDDWAALYFSFQESGWMIRCRIFHRNGFLIKELNTVNSGSESILTWDGSNDTGAAAEPGAYLLLAELYHPDGRINVLRRRIILANW